MNEERPDASSVLSRIEQLIHPVSSGVASVTRLPLAPTAAADQCAVVFHDKECAVPDKLAVNRKNESKRRLGLRRRIIRSVKNANGDRYQRLQGRNVLLTRKSYRPIRRGAGRVARNLAHPVGCYRIHTAHAVSNAQSESGS